MKDNKMIQVETVGVYTSNKEVFTICYISVDKIEIYELNVYNLISKKGNNIKFRDKPIFTRQYLKKVTSVEEILQIIKEKYGEFEEIRKDK